MPQPAVLLDTDILSELLKQHPLVVQRVRNYLAEHQRLAFSIITRYELLRGLKAKQARTQEAAFTLLCQASAVCTSAEQPCDGVEQPDAACHIIQAQLMPSRSAAGPPTHP